MSGTGNQSRTPEIHYPTVDRNSHRQARHQEPASVLPTGSTLHARMHGGSSATAFSSTVRPGLPPRRESDRRCDPDCEDSWSQCPSDCEGPRRVVATSMKLHLPRWPRSYRRSDCTSGAAMVVPSTSVHPAPPHTAPPAQQQQQHRVAPHETGRPGVVVGQEGRQASRRQPKRKSYFLRCRFSRTRMVTSMGVPSKPNVSRSRRWMKRR